MNIMAVFEKESEVLQDRNYRQHLNRNWDAGNKEIDAVNKRIDQIAGTTSDKASNEVKNARIDVHGDKFQSLSSRLDSDQITAENANKIARSKVNSEYVDNKLKNIVSGTPQGVFETVSDLKKAYPNGTNGIYIIRSSGHWYYYNKKWTDGGVWQAANLELGNVNLDGVNLLKGTSSQAQTINMVEWGGSTTATNKVKDMDLEIGKTYTYSFRAEDLPQSPAVLLVRLMKNSGAEKQAYQKNLELGLNTLTFTIPQNVDFDYVDARISFTKLVSQPEQLIGSSESFTRGKYAFPYQPNPDDGTPADGIKIINETLRYARMQNLAFKHETGINLLVNTKRELTDFSNLNDWGFVSQAKGGKGSYLFNEMLPNCEYTYSAEVANLPSAPMQLSVVLYDNQGKAISYKGTLTDKNGRFWLNFETPANVDHAELSLSFINKQTEKYNVSFGAEKLCIGPDKQYSKNYSELTAKELIDIVYNRVLVKEDDELAKKSYGLGLPIINIWEESDDIIVTDSKKIHSFDLYHDGIKERMFGSFAWQGQSSLSLPEKNFKLKTYKDKSKDKKKKWRPKQSFYKSHHFNLKAYYTDDTKIRDVTAAEIYSWMVADNDTAPTNLYNANHMGTIQGTPCLVYWGKAFYGLFMINTESSDRLWGIDEDDAGQMALETTKTSDATCWGSKPVYDDEIEMDSDNETNGEAAVDKLADLILVGKNNFVKNINQAFDINSLSDYFIFNFLIGNEDCWDGKNTVYLTYDNGTHWFLMPYDFNSSMLQSWQAGVNIEPIAVHNIGNALIRRFTQYFSENIQERYTYLTEHGTISPSRIVQELDRRYNEIPYICHKMDENRWPDNPSYDEDVSFDNIKGMFAVRKRMLDYLLLHKTENRFDPLAMFWGKLDDQGNRAKNFTDVTSDKIYTNGKKSFEFNSLDSQWINAGESRWGAFDDNGKLLGEIHTLNEGTNKIENDNASYIKLSINYVNQGAEEKIYWQWFALNRYSLIFK